jgi:putative transposase
MVLPEQSLQRVIEEVAAVWPRYGYRRVTHQLRCEGWIVNHKRVARIMRERGLQAHRKPKRLTTTDNSHTFRPLAHLHPECIDAMGGGMGE